METVVAGPGCGTGRGGRGTGRVCLADIRTGESRNVLLKSSGGKQSVRGAASERFQLCL